MESEDNYSVAYSSTPVNMNGSEDATMEEDVPILGENNEKSVPSASGNYQKKERQKKSLVWKEFTMVTHKDGTQKMVCNHCKTEMAKQLGGTTTQYSRHLKKCHKRTMCLKGQRNICITTPTLGSENASGVQSWKYDQAKIRETLSHLIMVHELPFSFAEYEIFNLLMRTASPYYERVSRAMVTGDCWTSYELEKKRLHGLLNSVDKISITTDMWTSNQNIQYMVITAHFVDSDWKLQKRVLNFVDVPAPHTGMVICDAIYKCFQEWRIEGKVWTITVDNASNNDAAVKVLLDNISFHRTLPLKGQLFHVRCCAHILNLLVQDGLSEIKGIIERVRESVKYITASTQRLQNFSDICKQLQLPSKKLILDCCTRWNATYAMLSCAVEFKQVFPRYLLRDPHYKYLPSDDDWHRVEEICSFLVHFNEITNIISGSEYPTANLFLPELWSIKELLDQKSTSEEPWLKAMATKMQMKFDKYWGNINLLLSIAAVLDPSNKMTLIEFVFPQVYHKDEATKQISVVRDSLYKLYEIYLNDHTTKNASYEIQVPNDATKRSSDNGKGKAIEIGRSKFERYVRSVDSVQHVKSELDTYLEEGVFICKENSSDFNALDWWKSNSLKFRVLSKMACEILAIPITTVASESTFSAGGRVIDMYRTSLGTDTVQMLLCGSDWLRNFYGLKRKAKFNEDVKEIALD